MANHGSGLTVAILLYYILRELTKTQHSHFVFVILTEYLTAALCQMVLTSGTCSLTGTELYDKLLFYFSICSRLSACSSLILECISLAFNGSNKTDIRLCNNLL